MTANTIHPNPAAEDTDVAACWAAYRADPGEATAVALLEHYLPLARRTVRSMAIYTPPDMDVDDLVQHALLGLWNAVRRFDEKRGVQFEAFALPHVRGAVRDALRRHDPLSRTDRTLLKKIEQESLDQFKRHGAVPDTTALARALDLAPERVEDLLTRAQPWLSLESTRSADGQPNLSLLETLPDEEAPSPEQETLKRERAARFREAFRQLPVRQQKILYLYYYEDLTLKDIGEALNLTEARICQVHAAGLLALRALMRAQDGR